MKKREELIDVIRSGAMTSQHEGFILGNGDLGALVFGNEYELKFWFGKNDCWDGRYDSDPEADILHQDDLITLIEEYGLEHLQRFNLTQDCQITIPISKKPIPTKYRTIYQTPAYWLKNEYYRPTPKQVGEVVFAGPGLSTTKMNSRLRISEGIFEVEYEYNSKTKIKLEGFIWAEGNILCIRYQAIGKIPWGRLVLRKYPDAVDDSIPNPVLSFPPPGDVVTITQKIPGDEFSEPFEWSISGKVPGERFNRRTERMDQRYASFAHLPKEDTVADYFIAVSTSRETKVETSRRAHEIVEYAAKIGYDALKASQQEWWGNFWSKSSVTLEDKDLERVWYRDLYMAACNIRKGKQAPSMYGNMIAYDASMWHGDFHMDKDFQQPFYPVLVTNHCDMMEPYIQAILDYIPDGEWLAEKMFGLEGFYVDIGIIPFVPPHKINIGNLYGRWLAMTGWTVFHFWWYYKYTLDKKWLSEKGYIAIKKAAQFYWNYLEKYQSKFDGDIYPSNVDEGRGWERNSSYDIACFRFAFRAAIQASEILGVDKEWREKWIEGIERLPKYPIIKINGEDYIAFTKDSKRVASGFLVWPSEDLNPDTETDYIKMVKKTLIKSNPKHFNSNMAWASAVAMARLRIPQTYDCLREAVFRDGLASFRRSNDQEIYKNGFAPLNGGYPSPLILEDVDMPLMISELLLQSYGGIIRLFPTWPRDKSASFQTLRAEGGFLVSSFLEKGEIHSTKIHSIIGGLCRIAIQKKNVEILSEDGKTIDFTKKDGIISFDTLPGKNYQIKISNR
jgi:hypothetical protein